MRRTTLTRWLLCGLTAVATLAASQSLGEQAFPYKAYVAADDVYVRSGPGQSYYPTDKLKSGDVVEVYRHDPGGWCAIRPPKGSFTWVSTRYLNPTDDGLAQINSPRVAARVGSRFSTIRDVIQVRLHQDEVVELLEEPRAGDDGWTRIAPPAGEFRWVQGKYLDPEYPVDGIRKSEPVAGRPGPDAVRATSWTTEGETVGEGIAPTRPPRFTPEEYQRRLEGLNLELSAMVAEEPTVWQFDEMALEAERLVAEAETALQRGQARMLLGKIERFENIKERYDTVQHVVADTDRRGRQLTARATRETAAAAGVAGRFDGAGRLTRVVSPKAGAPRYALVDEAGRVTCYITPSPGMNLRHYEQRAVGVNGTRAYIPEQRTYHVMATHINLLDDGRTR